jgi:hypothetical protein
LPTGAAQSTSPSVTSCSSGTCGWMDLADPQQGPRPDRGRRRGRAAVLPPVEGRARRRH